MPGPRRRSISAADPTGDGGDPAASSDAQALAGGGTDRTRHLPGALAGAGVAAAAVALLLCLGLVIDRYPFAFDRAILAGVRGSGPTWLAAAAINVTALGSGVVLTLVVLAAAGLLLVKRLPLTAAAIAAACWSGGRVVDLVKHAFARTRPDLIDRLVPVTGSSFPSGHAASSAICYLTLAALAAQVTPERAIRRYLASAAIMLVLLIGASRVYLGVHWPSDVLAGWSFGTLWALGWWRATAAARTRIGGER